MVTIFALKFATRHVDTGADNLETVSTLDQFACSFDGFLMKFWHNWNIDWNEVLKVNEQYKNNFPQFRWLKNWCEYSSSK